MALHEMPNGEYVDIDDGASPEVIASIKKQYSSRKMRAAGTPRKQIGEKKLSSAEFKKLSQSDQDKYVDYQRRYGGLKSIPIVGDVLRGFDDLTAGSQRGVTFSFNDELAGLGGAITGQGYERTRDRARAADKQASEDSPFLYGAGELTGAVANPLGTGGNAVQGAGRLAANAGFDGAANALTRAGQFLQGGGAVRQSVMAGGVQGALNGAGTAEELSDVPEAMLAGGGIGGLAGGAFGGLLHAGRRGVQILRDTGEDAAQRAAYTRIAKLGENGGLNPEQMAQVLKAADELGGDMRVADVTPGLRAQATSLARKPDVRGSDDLIEMGTNRAGARRDRFGEQVREQSGQTDDVLFRREDMQSKRKDMAQVDYREGGALDKQINWSDDLNKFFQEAPDADKLVRNAYTNAMRFGDDVGRIADASGQVVPSMRAFDYLKKEFDDAIGAALKRGEKGLAAGLSNQLNRLKGIIADANPEYSDVLARQRDAFQQQKASEMGEEALRRITAEPRKLLKEVRNFNPAELQEWRIGFIDALVNWERRGDPVKVFRDAMASPAQKKVFEAAFGGKGNLGRMERWVAREGKSALTDAKVSGPQAITSEALLAEGADTVPSKGDVIKNAFRGLGFGGLYGAAGNALSTLGRIANGTNRLTQEEIIKILMSRGENLVAGTEAAASYAAKREANNKLWSRTAAKAAQQPYTDAIGD